MSSGSFSYNPDDELASETYDANGNVTAANGHAYQYDSQNELVSMNGGAVRLVYDGDGNRVEKTVNGVTTRYLVDDLNPTGYAQVVEETGGVNRTYTYGLQRISENQIVNNAWTPSFYEYDGMGSVRQLTNSAGAVTDTYEYDAFGNLLNKTGTTPNEMRYRGEQWDSDLGLYYLRARWYNPQTGRFMGRDPEYGDSFSPKTMHKYLYADGDPINGIDPTGRATAAPTMPGRASIGGAIGEYGALILGIAVRAIPAVTAVGCAVSIRSSMDALGAVNDFDIIPTWNCRARGETRMRIQLQKGINVTVSGTPVLTADDPPGVTKAQARAGLMGLWGLAASGQTQFPKSLQRGLRSAIIEISQCIGRQSGTLPGKYTVCQAYVTGDQAGWRIDLENLNGINLRQ